MQVFALVVSVIALAISAYGIVERRLAAERDLRARLVAVVEELYDLNLTEAKEQDAGADPYGSGLASLRARRALLAEQALMLEAMIRGRLVTAEEYSSMAEAYEYQGDLDQALALRTKAVDRATRRPGSRTPSSTAMTLAACWRSLAGCHCQRREPEAMRHAARRALAATPVGHDRGRLDYVQTCVDWADGECGLDPTGPAFAEALKLGTAMAERIVDESARNDAQSLLAAVR